MRATGHWQAWRHNAEHRGVPAEVIAEITREHQFCEADFRALETMEQIIDPDGKSFFLVPTSTDGDDARAAVLMTYVINAGTGYGRTDREPTDFRETPYSSTEISRVIHRQQRNRWTYHQDVAFVNRNGGRLVTTPNGILMGVGGNWVQRAFSQQGGTAWGDIFMVNIKTPDPAQQLRRIVRSGHAWYSDKPGKPCESGLDLDRVLHHEELHCRQWADNGYAGMITAYLWEALRDKVFGKTNRLEQAAGLADGGYA